MIKESPDDDARNAERTVRNRFPVWILMAVVLQLSLAANPVFAQESSRFRDLSPRDTPSPESLFQKLAEYQIKPTNLTPIYSELEKQGRDIFKSLSPDQKAEARMLAEQLLRNRGLEAPEVKSLMDRMGVDKNTQKRLAEQFGGGLMKTSSTPGNLANRNALDEVAKQLQSSPSNREDFKRALSDVASAENLDLDRLWEGDPGAKNGAKNLSQEQLLDLLDSLGAGQNLPKSNKANLSDPRQSGKKANELNLPDDEPRKSEQSGSDRDAASGSLGRPRMNRDLPKLQNGQSSESGTLESVFDDIDGSDNANESSPLTIDRQEGSNPQVNKDDSTAELLSKIDQLVKREGSDSSTDLGLEASVDRGSERRDDLANQNSISSRDADADGRERRDRSTQQTMPNRGDGQDIANNSRDDSGSKVDDEVWAKEFYETAKKVLPRLKNDLDGGINREQLQALKDILNNKAPDVRGPSLNDMLDRGTSMLANAQGNPALKEKIEARFDRMLVDVAKRTIENAEKKDSKNAFDKLLGDVFDRTIESAKDGIQEIKKSRREAKKQTNNGSRELDASIGTEDLSGMLQRVQDQNVNTNNRQRDSSNRENSTGANAAPPSVRESLAAIAPPAVELGELFSGPFWLVVLIGVILLGLLVWLVSKAQWGTSEEAVRKKKLMEKLRSIRDPKDFVDAVDLYLLAHHGDDAAWWNAEHAKQEVESNRPQFRDRIANLFNLYVLSRYTQNAPDVSTEDRAQAESTLNVLVKSSENSSVSNEVTEPTGSSDQVGP